MHIGASELLLLLFIILILFGSSRFPKIMANFAEGLKTFKKSFNGKNSDKNKTKSSVTKKSKSSTRKK